MIINTELLLGLYQLRLYLDKYKYRLSDSEYQIIRTAILNTADYARMSLAQEVINEGTKNSQAQSKTS